MVKTRWTNAVNAAFAAVFTFEIVMRLLAWKKNFFTSPTRYWNMFDLFVVVVTDIEACFSFLMNLTFARTLRIFRFVRTFRLITFFRLFRDLRLMVASIMGCISSLTWGMVLLGVVLYAFSVALLDGTAVHIQYSEDPLSMSDRDTLLKYYHGLPKTMLSLVMAFSGGQDWGMLAEPFMNMNARLGATFFVCVMFVMFGLTNVVVAVFVQRAQELEHLDKEVAMQEQMDRESSSLNCLKTLFSRMDSNKDGILTIEELEACFSDQTVTFYFNMLGIDCSEATGLFRLLDVDDSNEVCVEEFLMGCMRLKGTAKSIDIAHLLYDNKRENKKLQSYMAAVSREIRAVRSMLSHPEPWSI